MTKREALRLRAGDTVSYFRPGQTMHPRRGKVLFVTLPAAS
jgi:hypothetical protein